MKEYGMVNEMIFDFAVRSIIGTREEQQDCVGVTELSDGLLGIVCDGMGGMTTRQYLKILDLIRKNSCKKSN